VTGTNRLVFTLFCIMICVGVYKLTIKPPVLIHKIFSLLGETSYSIYLLHPIVLISFNVVFDYMEIRGVLFPKEWRVIMSIVITVVLSYFVYFLFEKRLIKIGNKLITT